MALQKILIEKLEEIRLKNPSFSLRAYAKKLAINSSALSEIINGKRRISLERASKILQRMNLTADEIDRILFLFPEKKSIHMSGLNRKSFEEQKKMLRLRSSQFELVSKWYYFAVLSLMETDDFRSNPDWISGRLGISVLKVKEALVRLEELKIISISEDDEYKFIGINISSTDDIASLAIRQAHRGQLELAEESLDRDAVNIRDFTSITMAIDPKKMQDAKKLIRDFRSNLSKLLESGDQKEVYIFSNYLYPVSRRE